MAVTCLCVYACMYTSVCTCLLIHGNGGLPFYFIVTYPGGGGGYILRLHYRKWTLLWEAVGFHYRKACSANQQNENNIYCPWFWGWDWTALLYKLHVYLIIVCGSMVGRYSSFLLLRAVCPPRMALNCVWKWSMNQGYVWQPSPAEACTGSKASLTLMSMFSHATTGPNVNLYIY